MLAKAEVLPIGSIVSVKFADEDQEMLAMIVGHLSLVKRHRCHYDYICIEYPSGVERGIFYINQPDIIEIHHRTDDYDGLHSKMMERKYGEYIAFYKHYSPESRPSIDKMRQTIILSDNLFCSFKNIMRRVKYITILIFIISTVITAVVTQSIYAVIGAFVFAVLGWTIGR